MNTCILIPVYNNPNTIARVVDQCLQKTELPILVVDDGSQTKVESLLHEQLTTKRITIFRHETNKGKGEALKTGFREALAKGYKFTLTIDGDGQHDPADIPIILNAAEYSQHEIMIGARRMNSSNSPWLSRLGRSISDGWISLITNNKVSDSQCGVRLYPLESMRGIKIKGSRFDYEMEVLVQLLWRGVKCRSIEISVSYNESRVSHFHKFFDNLRIASANIRLLISKIKN